MSKQIHLALPLDLRASLQQVKAATEVCNPVKQTKTWTTLKKEKKRATIAYNSQEVRLFN
jgi:hypothetical protein